MVHHIAVFNHHAFRFTGGAGGIKNVRQIGFFNRNRRLGRTGFNPVNANGNTPVRLHPPAEIGDGNNHLHGGVADDEIEAVGRIVGIERNIRPARFEDAENPDAHFGRAVYKQADRCIGRNAEFLQPHGQRIGSRVEFGIRQLFIHSFDGNGTRRFLRLRLEELMNAAGVAETGRARLEFLKILMVARGQHGLGK